MIGDKENVIEIIRRAFGENAYPGDNFLQDSLEGCEPYEEVGPFKGRSDWSSIESGFLDAHAGALSFFSQAGFRFFLPAYLIADLHGQLKTADPLFHLTQGFSDITVEAPLKDRVFLLRTGKSEFVNPQRYGAMTFHDYARYRLSVFAREEAYAIVAYLKYKRDCASSVFIKGGIDAALESYWIQRAETAPARESLNQHLTEKAEFLAATLDSKEEP